MSKPVTIESQATVVITLLTNGGMHIRIDGENGTLAANIAHDLVTLAHEILKLDPALAKRESYKCDPPTNDQT